MSLYRNRYRIESARLPHWDYTTDAWYFITICTRDRQHFFGHIASRQMHLSTIGKIVAEEWQKTSEIRPSVTLDAWVVMPNHFHAIIGIQNGHSTVETFRRNVSTNPPKLRPNSLGSIVGQFKSVCTKRIWAGGSPEFGWQPRFYDRIIRDQAAFDRVRLYIQNNPANWQTDQHFG